MSISPLNRGMPSLSTQTASSRQPVDRQASPVKPPTELLVAPPPPNNNKEDIEAAVKTLNSFTEASSNELRFSLDHESKKTVVKVIDINTQEVLRQIPSEEALSIAKSIDKMKGILIHRTA